MKANSRQPSRCRYYQPATVRRDASASGLHLAIDSGVEYIWIEGDSRIGIEILNGWKKAEPADEKELMEECRNLMKTFKEATTKHAFREANQSADDHLANMGAEEGVEQQWRSRLDPPLSLMPFLERGMGGCLVFQFFFMFIPGVYQNLCIFLFLFLS